MKKLLFFSIASLLLSTTAFAVNHDRRKYAIPVKAFAQMRHDALNKEFEQNVNGPLGPLGMLFTSCPRCLPILGMMHDITVDLIKSEQDLGNIELFFKEHKKSMSIKVIIPAAAIKTVTTSNSPYLTDMHLKLKMKQHNGTESKWKFSIDKGYITNQEGLEIIQETEENVKDLIQKIVSFKETANNGQNV